MAARKKPIKGSAKADGKYIIPRDYAAWLASLKSRISGAGHRATLAVNQELVRLYHHIGTEILERQTRQGWGAKVIDRLAADLRAAFPEMKGFSSSNLKYMRFFAEECPAGPIGQQPADQLPWFHFVTVFTKVSADTQRESAETEKWARRPHSSDGTVRAPASPLVQPSSRPGSRRQFMGDLTHTSTDVRLAIVQGAAAQLVSLPTIARIEAELSCEEDGR